MSQDLDGGKATGQFIISSEHLTDDACTDWLDDAKPTGNNVTRAQELKVASLLHHSFTRRV